MTIITNKKWWSPYKNVNVNNDDRKIFDIGRNQSKIDYIALVRTKQHLILMAMSVWNWFHG